MSNKMLIDASHPEETRVVVVRDKRIAEYDFESEHKKQIKGNIYLARVTRIEPSLQAAFVEYGGNKQGFLAFSEIHPDYYQIPQADRQALLNKKTLETSDKDQESEQKGTNLTQEQAPKKTRKKTKQASSAEDHTPTLTEDISKDDTDFTDDNFIESVGAEDALEEAPTQHYQNFHYKIQEVIKKRQILLVQVIRDERGNKGAGLTTYLSLAGRYSVLMPNTNRGGGISRKITNPQDRKRLKEIAKSLAVPEGMGVILRTAGASRTKLEIKRDYDYLLRLWNKIRECALSSIAPTLIHEEGSLIKRSIRDLYDKSIDEILVAGDAGYKEAKSFIRMLMPSHTKVVQPYNEATPIFAQNNIEVELDKMLQPQVSLKSGGYLVMNQTEALVAIDVNSGRATKENSIEETAYQTNLEAADEIALQLRLRDLAGLIVIDFIDMEDRKNIRAVEKRLKDGLKADRARIQVGRISPFGLLEMSRQRIRASVLESTMYSCPTCKGTGHIRSESSIALHVLRSIEDYLLQNPYHNILLKTSVGTALYILNNKRQTLTDLEKRFQLAITIMTDSKLDAQHFSIEKQALTEYGTAECAERLPQSKEVVNKNPSAKQVTKQQPTAKGPTNENSNLSPLAEEEAENTNNNKKRRRGRRGGRRNKNSILAKNLTDSTPINNEIAFSSSDEKQPETNGNNLQNPNAKLETTLEGEPKKPNKEKSFTARQTILDEHSQKAVTAKKKPRRKTTTAKVASPKEEANLTEAAGLSSSNQEGETSPKKTASKRRNSKAKASKQESIKKDLSSPSDIAPEATSPDQKKSPRRKASRSVGETDAEGNMPKTVRRTKTPKAE